MTVVKIYHQRQLVFSTELTETLEIGRQRPGEPGPFCRTATPQATRIIIAPLNENLISRQHALLEPLRAGKVRVTNRSGALAIGLEGGGQLAAGLSHEVEPPVLLTLGGRALRLEPAPDEQLQLESLAEKTLSPGSGGDRSVLLTSLISRGAGSEQLAQWLQRAMELLQSAASSADFLPQAAATLLDVVRLDVAAVVLRDGNDWNVDTVRTAAGATSDPAWAPSRTMLARVLAERRTFRRVPNPQGPAPQSLEGVRALVAAPILDKHGDVIAALYGERRQNEAAIGRGEVTELEAMLVELLACGVAAGLARLEQERATLAARVRFEQFFTAELARRLESEPDLLAGKDTDVTVLFCDIRGFSRVSERIGPAGTVAWINDVLGVLSDCVIEHHGVLVDYVGDELLAMWGAPDPNPDHARLACRAALQMMRRMPALNEHWQDRIGEPFGIGIGINTGPARVGNTGSHRKFKYGPLGNTVNLGSRVQGATKYVKTNSLITGATADRLDTEFFTRRLCRARVVNIVEPVALYELTLDGSAGWLQLKAAYESALTAFESRNLLAAAKTLGELLEQHPGDGPTLVLLSRAVNALVHDEACFNPDWELPGK